MLMPQCMLEPCELITKKELQIFVEQI